MTGRKRTAYYFTIISVLLLWSISIWSAQNIEEKSRSISLRYDQKLWGMDQIDAIFINSEKDQDGGQPFITAWDEQEPVTVQEEGLGKKETVKLVSIYGDMEAVIPGLFLSGGAPSKGDDAGCVIDKATAYGLFGTLDVTGSRVRCSNQEYRVRGVIRTSRRVMLVQTGAAEILFSNIELQFEDTSNERLMESFINQNFSYPPAVRVNGYQMGSLAKEVSLMPAWFLMIGMIVRGFGIIKDWKINLALKITTGAILVFLLIWFAEFRILIPDSYIPTKWLDFEFYTAKAGEVKSGLESFFSSRLTAKELELAGNMLLCLLFSGYTVIAMGIFFKTDGNQTRGSWKEWATDIGMIAAAALLLILIYAGSGNGIRLPVCFPGLLAAAVLINYKNPVVKTHPRAYNIKKATKMAVTEDKK